MRFTQSFEITKWDQATYDDAGGLELGRATVGKTFTPGATSAPATNEPATGEPATGEPAAAEPAAADLANSPGLLDGTSSAELLMVGTPAGPAAYTAVERFTGKLDGREGTFVMTHGASVDETSSHGKIVAAAGDLTGLTGTVIFQHDDQGPRITLDYELP